MLGWTQFVIFWMFGWVLGSILMDKLGFGRVWSSVFRIWVWLWPVSDWTDSKFGLLGWVWKDSKFSFSGWTWVWMSSKFDPSSSKFLIYRFDPTLFWNHYEFKLLEKKRLIWQSIQLLQIALFLYCRALLNAIDWCSTYILLSRIHKAIDLLFYS